MSLAAEAENAVRGELEKFGLPAPIADLIVAVLAEIVGFLPAAMQDPATLATIARRAAIAAASEQATEQLAQALAAHKQ